MSSLTEAPLTDEPGEESHRTAALLCLAGLFLKILLSDPLLNAMGLHYSDETGGDPLTKIHPGTYMIYLSFMVLLLDHGRPLRQVGRTYREYPVYAGVLVIYIVLFLYWALRNPVGVGLLIDSHIPFVVTAIVLSYAPCSYCRAAVYSFIALSAINSMIGIAESIGQFRIFTFDPSWVVLKEEHFRASAFLGHPLNNAIFTSIALFVAMSVPMPGPVKFLLMCIYMASLVAFGGRAGIAFSFLGLIPVGFIAIKNSLTRSVTILRLLLIVSAALLVPLMIVGGLYVLLNTHMGDRLMALRSLDDESAEGRALAFKVFDYMTPDEMIFGTSTDRVVDIAYRMGLTLPISDIENPWVLMFMFFGYLMFPVWLAATAAFAWRLIRGKPLTLQLAVLAYYVVASGSNSFGRKDANYGIMVGMVICAARTLEAIRMTAEAETSDSATTYGLHVPFYTKATQS